MSSCSGGDSFRITGFQLGAFDGCYSASSVSTFNFLPIFYNTADGVPADGPAVYASDLFGTLSNEYVWSIGNYDQSGDVVDTRHCVDADGTDASTIHPSEVAAWTCEDSDVVTSTAFALACGCSTPAPTTTGPASTPSPDDNRDIDAPSSSPATAAELAGETPQGDPEGVPLAIAIVTGVAVFVVMMIILSIVLESLRKTSIWMCLTCKRESASEDAALSTPGSSASRLPSRE